jgi:hypothetical protein
MITTGPLSGGAPPPLGLALKVRAPPPPPPPPAGWTRHPARGPSAPGTEKLPLSADWRRRRRRRSRRSRAEPRSALNRASRPATGAAHAHQPAARRPAHLPLQRFLRAVGRDTVPAMKPKDEHECCRRSRTRAAGCIRERAQGIVARQGQSE